MRRGPTPPPRPSGQVILAIDYGRKRLGLAVSDSLGMTARPLAIWERTNRRQDLARLRGLCRESGVTSVVVGWPLHLDGSESEMAEEASRFAARVKANLRLPVELVDERLSSWESRELAGSAGTSRRRAKAVDDVAAAVILRDYLARAGRAHV